MDRTYKFWIFYIIVKKVWSKNKFLIKASSPSNNFLNYCYRYYIQIYIAGNNTSKHKRIKNYDPYNTSELDYKRMLKL